MGIAFPLVDSLVNFVTGLGTKNDKSAHTLHTFNFLDRGQLEAAYRSDWIARKVIDCPAKDATREWREWQADREDITKIENLERDLFIKRKIQWALILARLYGGAIIIIGVGTDNPETELTPEKVRKGGLKYVHVLSRYECSWGPVIWDVTSPWYGQPEYWTRSQIGTSVDGKVEAPGIKIHPSRVVKFVGNPRPPESVNAYDPWGDSNLQVVDDAVRGTGLVVGSIATMTQEATVDIYKVPGFSEMITNNDYKERLTQRFTYANVSKSINNALILDSLEEHDRVQTSFTALPDLISMYLLIAAGAADIPATRMLSQSPKGLNATGESDIRNYYDAVGSEQRNTLQPDLTVLDKVLVQSALGTTDPSIFYNWKPLWQMDETEKATIALQKAQAFQIDVNCGLVEPLALKEGRENQLIEDGTYPGFEQALEDAALITNYGPEDFALAFGPQPPEPPKPLVLNAGQRVVNPPQGGQKPPARLGDASAWRPGKRSRFLKQAAKDGKVKGQKIDDSNPNHKGPGPGGGQFASGGGGGGGHDISRDMTHERGPAKQPVKDFDELVVKSKEAEPEFVSMVTHAAATVHGGNPMFARNRETGSTLKRADRSLQKIHSDYGGDPSRLLDMLRGTVVAPTVQETRTAAAAFIAEMGDRIVRVKDRCTNPVTGGYRDIMINVKTSNGMIGEVQFNTPHILAAKGNAGHRVYEDMRAPPKGLSENGRVAYIKDKEEQIKSIYGAAYQADGNGGWERKK